jgi:Ubiquitin C-terminal hydrolase
MSNVVFYIVQGINQKKSGWRDRLPIPRLDETTLTHRMFGGYLRSQVRCTRCKYKSNTYDPFLDLSLEVSSKKIGSLYDALTEYTRKETLDAANKWKCSGCKKHVCATKQLTIFRPPLTLCIQLKRFSFGGGFGGFMHHQGYSHFAGKGMGMAKGGSKVQKLIEFPASLKLPLSDGRKCEYILTGVIVHIGGSATSGHYTAFVRRTSKNNTVQWLNVDDSFVEPVPEKTVLRNKDAYVLFYCRKEVQLEMPSIPQSCSSESSNSSKDENMSTKKKKKVENQSNEVVSEHNNSDTVNVQHPSLNTSEKSQIDNKPMELKRAPIPAPPDEELERTPSPLPTNKENLSNGTQSTSANTELGRTHIPLAPNKENSSNGTQSISSNIIAIYRDGKEDNNHHSQTEKSSEKVQATIGVESPSLKSNETSVMANDATKKSHSSDTRKKEISLDMGSMGRVKVMLRSLKARNKAWKPLPKAKEGPTKENSLLGERAIGGWDDDDDESKETETRNTSLEKEAKIRRTIFSETKLHEKSRKRKMYLDSWDRALDAGKVKKVKGKTTTSHSSEHITSRENPFHRIQQSMLQMKSGPKGFHKTSKQTRSKK